MAKRYEKHVHEVEEKTDNVVRIVAMGALIAALVIRATNNAAVPDYALIGIISVFAKDFFNFFARGRK